jgi:hypothetical protein
MEKRFTIQTDNAGFNYCIQDNGKDLSDVELIFLLNELYEENQKLINSASIMKLDEFERLIKENNKLKNEIMEYYQIVNCGNCRYHNYDWYDDGDEFEVCDKGNAERLIYSKFCNEWEQL